MGAALQLVDDPSDLPNPSGLCHCGCGETTLLARQTRRDRGAVKGEHRRFVQGHSRRGLHAFVPIDRHPNPTGLCMCGCGQTTLRGYVKIDDRYIPDAHRRYVHGHHARGRTHSNAPRGADSPHWKGGRGRSHGYVTVWVDPADPLAVMGSTRSGHILEHRVVMARYLGRPLARHEQVHHINGDRADNRIENLQLQIGSHGAGQAHVCLDCGSTRIAPVGLAEA